MQQMFVADAGSQDTWLNNAELRFTTATLTTRFKGGTTKTFEDKYQTMDVPKTAQQQMRQGETCTRLREKAPTIQESAAPHTIKGAARQGLPHPSEVRSTEKAHTGRATRSILHTRTARTDTGQDRHQAAYTLETNHSQPIGERHNTRLVEDECWTGKTNFEDIRSFLHNLSQTMRNNNKAQKQR